MPPLKSKLCPRSLTMTRRKKWQAGNVVEIKLADGSFSYGLILEEPLIAFSKAIFNQRQIISEKIFEEIAFQLMVMNSAIGKNGWPIIGDLPVNKLSIGNIKFYRYDRISNKFYHYVDSINDIQVSRDECVGLECAAVWSKNHIEDRLYALKNGMECPWRESLRAEKMA